MPFCVRVLRIGEWILDSRWIRLNAYASSSAICESPCSVVSNDYAKQYLENWWTSVLPLYLIRLVNCHYSKSVLRHFSRLVVTHMPACSLLATKRKWWLVVRKVSWANTGMMAAEKLRVGRGREKNNFMGSVAGRILIRRKQKIWPVYWCESHHAQCMSLVCLLSPCGHFYTEFLAVCCFQPSYNCLLC